VTFCFDERPIELPDLVEDPLSGAEVEDRNGRAAERAQPSEAHGADDAELLDRTPCQHSDRVADLVVLRVGGLRVDRDLVVPLGPAAGGQDERVEPLIAFRIDAERKARRAARAREHLVVAAYKLRLVCDAAFRQCDAGKPANLLQQRFGERRRRDGVPVRARSDRALAGDHGVRVLVDLVEDGSERRLDRVGQDERAADHRDTEHDRDRGE